MAGLFALLGLTLLHGGLSFAGPAMTITQLGSRTAEAVLVVVVLVVHAAAICLPGFVVFLVASTLYSRRERMTGTAWAGLFTMLLGCVLLAAVHIRESGRALPGGQLDMDGNDIHSGEEVMLAQGKFMRLADPSKVDGSPLEPGWRTGLIKSLAKTIAGSQEQVILVFSRQGCPWCERQVPVLQRAIARRAATHQAATEGGGRAAGGTALVTMTASDTPTHPPAGVSLLFAPLRVFVLDAAEFPKQAMRFNVQAFPTLVVFGVPGVAPLMAEGYLDDEALEQVLRAAAVGTPEAQGAPQSKKKLFR